MLEIDAKPYTIVHTDASSDLNFLWVDHFCLSIFDINFLFL